MIKLTKALVLLAPGFEEIEAFSIVDVLRRCHIKVIMAGLKPNVIEGSHGIKVISDKYIDDISVTDFDVVVCPGGSPGFENLRKDQRVISLVKEAFELNKVVAAICGAPAVLSDAGILGKTACTIYPGMENELLRGGGIPQMEDLVVEDGNIITSKGPATAIAFALKIALKLVDRQVVEDVKKEMLADVGVKFQ